MVDIQVRPFLDLTRAEVQQRLLNKIASGRYDAVIFSPPCSTFSRVVWANRRGPRPVRAFTKPRGLVRLSWAERKRANWGNTMADFTYKAFELQARQPEGIAVFENPEDLGAVKSGENFGIRPASMWQWPQFAALLELEQVQSIAFYQQDFGTEYLKPTRLLLAHVSELPESFVQGPPTFDDQGFYTGPLRSRAAVRQLVGASGSAFATTGTEQWPSNFCKWVATMVLQQFLAKQKISPAIAGEGKLQNSDSTDFPTLEPDGDKLTGGHGPPRQCQQPGKERQFHDGAGLPSMGRWDPDKRIWNNTFWRELRKETMDLIVQHLGDERKLDRACFEMAVKGEAGCDIVCDENLKQNLRELWMRKLRQHGSVLEALDYRAPGQPFYLRLFKELLAFSGDVDRDFLLQGETGYPVGVDLPLPRTPHVFEEQTSWKLENDPHMQEEIWRSNYQSVEAHKDFVRQHFEEECAEGLMEKLTIEEAKAKYGKRIAISSLAVLVEENHQGKRRVIHDATHGTRINNRIRCRDKVRSPSSREKQYLLAFFQQCRASVFSLVGDISKAHRRFLHAPEERGLLSCRISEDDVYVYVNKVGTFGLACASYWWARIAGAGIRLMHEMLGPQMPVDLLIFADDLEAIASSAGGRRGITLSFLFLSCLGFPFKWAKQRGGLRVEWIGLFTDYTSYKIGLSPKRAEWMQSWVMKLASEGYTTPKAFEQGLGRLGFSALALLWEKPFLGPLYSWSAAIRNKRGTMRLPAMLRAILLFLGERFKEGGQLQEAPPLKQGTEEVDDLPFLHGRQGHRERSLDRWLSSKSGWQSSGLVFGGGQNRLGRLA